MKHIHVTCAIIERNGLVLAARRSAFMQLPLKWEFPGGKIRAGEDPGECLKREIREELALDVDIAGELTPPSVPMRVRHQPFEILSGVAILRLPDVESSVLSEVKSTCRHQSAG